MPVPTYDQFIEPVLRYLAEHLQGAAAREVSERAADALGLSAADRALVLDSGVQAVYRNRAGWAHDRLKRAGYSASPRRGEWKITVQGLTFLANQPSPFPAEAVAAIAASWKLSRSRPLGEAGAVGAIPLLPVTTGPDAVNTPEERLEAVLAEMREQVVADLQEALGQVSPQRFEYIVLDLLLKMGYGADRRALERMGGVGDGGIDGVISLDRLGLEKVYVQAKRWHGMVGRPDIQAFYGALAGQHAKKGVFMTTSSFTPQALDFARSVEGIVLIDGQRLAGLMIEHGVGIAQRPLGLASLDKDYFEE